MIGATFKVNPTKWFFDRQLVLDKVDKARVRNLSKIGAYIRTRARRSIRPSKTASRPGNPPHSHIGLLRDKIYFSYDNDTGGAVVGPVKLNLISVVNGSFRSGTVPEILEYGGTIGVVEQWSHWVRNKNGTRGGWTRLDLRERGAKKLAIVAVHDPGMLALTRIRQVKIEARPYMQPALKAETTNPKLRAAWENTLR